MSKSLAFCCGACCGVARILCYTCCKPFRKEPPVKAEYNVICLGLSMTGKTTLLATFCGEELGENIERTTGFNMKDIILSTSILHVKEIGGSEQVRKYWHHYIVDDHDGLIFVVDSSVNDGELGATINELRNILNSPSLKNLPLLVLATHQDKQNAQRGDDINSMFLLDELAAGRPYCVHPCVSTDFESIRVGFEKLASLLWQNDNHMEQNMEQNRI